MDRVREWWSSLRRDNKRVILMIVGLSVVLSIVVIATVSKSASLKEPKLDGDSKPWEEIRLPEKVVPSHYDVKLRIDMTNERFSGSEDVYVDVLEETLVVLIHINSIRDDVIGYEMNVTESSVKKIAEDLSESEIKIAHAFPYTPNSFFVMKMKEILQPGKYKLSFVWESRLMPALDGIYLSSYKEDEGTKKVLASQMEPLAARKVIPCFDEPDFKANFSMVIEAEKIYPLVLWNMPVAKKTEVDAEWDEFTYQTSVKMSTYLLAFIVADFTCTPTIDARSTNGKDIEVRTCGRKAQIDASAGAYSAQITADIIIEYEKFYGEPYPLPKIDSVAVPDFSAGAMENWGLILYRETALLYDPTKDTYSNKARVNAVVAHELAHQWFGNLVTMKWWNDLWLNEGFASYVEWIGTTSSEPDWGYTDVRTYLDKSRAFSIDAYTSSRPTSIPVEKPADITAQFDSISYSKGSALLVQAKMFMDGTADTENFENAIRNYIENNKFANTIQNDLYRELDSVYKTQNAGTTIDIVKVMETWTLQMNFPVLQVRRYDDKRISISQRRFLISGTDTSGDKPSPYGYQWYVPVQYSVGSTAKTDVKFEWLHPYSTILVEYDFESDVADFNFIHLNKESAGYYIVDYSYDLSQQLRSYLSKDEASYQSFSVSERQGMLFDAFLFVSEGSKPMSDGLTLLNLMVEKEKKYTPLREIARQISNIGVHVSGNEELSELWKIKNKDFAKKLYDDTSANDYLANEDQDLPEGFQERMKVLMAINLACGYGVQECVDAAKAQFTKYKNGQAELVPEFKSTIFKTVISVSPVTEEVKEDWKFLWKEYQDSQQATEKDVIYYALGLIDDDETLRNFSEDCLNSSLVRPADALYILGRSIAQTRRGRVVSWAFMQENWERLTLEFTDALFAVDAYITGVLQNFSDQATLDKIEAFFSDKLASLGSGRAAYEGALQSIKANIAWLAKHQSSVEAYVQ